MSSKSHGALPEAVRPPDSMTGYTLRTWYKNSKNHCTRPEIDDQPGPANGCTLKSRSSDRACMNDFLSHQQLYANRWTC
eukprot:6479386-Amphidinium_carterae.2